MRPSERYQGICGHGAMPSWVATARDHSYPDPRSLVASGTGPREDAVKSTLSLALIALWIFPTAIQAQFGAPEGQWPHYGGDLGATQYAALSSIDHNNVDRLGIAWRWSSPDIALAADGLAPEVGRFPVTPIMVGDVLYVRTALSQVAAIDAATGEQLWVFDPKSYEVGRPVNLGFNTRGVGHWSDGDESRIFVATGDSHLWSINADTGAPDPAFGGAGTVDLIEGLRRGTPRGSYQVMSPPLVIGDVVVVGSSISDGPRNMTAPPGDIRGFDVRNGRELWVFHTVPQAGEVGNETWEDDSWEYTGNTNVWSIMSADPELGLVYLPIGTPTNDWYGGHRLGDNLFAESLVAIDASTGQRVWHFQVVHHGLWDYDLPAAPTLVDIRVDGRRIPAVVQVTKQGFAFVFDRATGEPVWPIEERPVPPSTVPGERSSPTQPFPTKPPAFERQGISVDELIDFSPELRAEAEEILARFDYGGLYHPPSERGTVSLPGWQGGANWYGAAADPETGLLYVPSSTNPINIQIVPGNPERGDLRWVRGRAEPPRGPQGLPLSKPPYARLTAIDLSEGEIAWQVPLGDGPRQQIIDMGLADPGPLGGGGFTGPLLIETMLFIGHTGRRGGGENRPALLALNKTNGDLIHTIELPTRPMGTPMTYLVNGEQYIVIGAGQGEQAGLVALRLTR